MLVPQVKYVYVGYKRAGHGNDDLVFIFFNTWTSITRSRLPQPETDAVNNAASEYLPIFVLNTDKTIPQERDKSQRVPGAKHD